MAAERKSEAELIRALSEDLALEILASYMPEDFADADFTSLGEAAVYLAQHEPGVGPALQDLIAKVQKVGAPDQPMLATSWARSRGRPGRRRGAGCVAFRRRANGLTLKGRRAASEAQDPIASLEWKSA